MRGGVKGKIGVKGKLVAFWVMALSPLLFGIVAPHFAYVLSQQPTSWSQFFGIAAGIFGSVVAAAFT